MSVFIDILITVVIGYIAWKTGVYLGSRTPTETMFLSYDNPTIFEIGSIHKGRMGKDYIVTKIVKRPGNQFCRDYYEIKGKLVM